MRKPLFLGALLGGLLIAIGPVEAQEPVQKASVHLEQILDSLLQVEEELAKTEQALSNATTPRTARPLQTRLKQLKATQNQLLLEIEQLIGGLPPAVGRETPITLEQDLKYQRRHHEAIQDKNANRRLQSK